MNTSKPRKVGLLGFGEIGRSILAAWSDDEARDILAAICVRPGTAGTIVAGIPASIAVVDTPEALIACGIDLVIEAAGQPAACDYVPRLIDAGIDVHLLSTGALADPMMIAALSNGGKGRLMLPAGALAGLDGLRSMRQNGLSRVRYHSIKPPAAWKGTPAQALFDLDRLAGKTIVFSGSAREATQRFPQNANLAAAVAFAGIGLDRTEVELVADPEANENIGIILAETETETLNLCLSGRGFEGNPKSSRLTGMSVLAALENDHAHFVFV